MWRIVFQVFPLVVWCVAILVVVKPMKFTRRTSLILSFVILVSLSKFAFYAVVGGDGFNPDLPAGLIWFCGWIYAAAILLTFQAVPAFAADVVNVDVDAKYLYEEARSMLSMINTFRTGEDAWYLGTDNRSRIPVRNLRQLSYDYNLEKTAMQRALELAVYFSHTRPDGSPWKTAYPCS